MLRKYILIYFTLLPVAYLANARQTTVLINSVSGTVVYHQEVNMLYLYEQSDTLHFDRTKSIFHWNLNAITPRPLTQKQKNAAVGGNISMQTAIYHGRRVNVHDTEKDSLFSLMGLPNINKLLYVKEKAPQFHWSIKDSTKNIGNYKVQKATTHYHGRDYTAWFSPKIPVPYGPWKLHGLPGLILQAYDQTGNIYFSATDITLGEVGSIGPVTLTGKEEIITLAEYKEITKNYEKYQKQNLMKMVRAYLSEKELANMNFETQPVRHMEIFEEKSAQ